MTTDTERGQCGNPTSVHLALGMQQVETKVYTPGNDPARPGPAASCSQDRPKRGPKSSCGNLSQEKSSRKARAKTACVDPTQDPISSHGKNIRRGNKESLKSSQRKSQTKTQGSESKSSQTHQGQTKHNNIEPRSRSRSKTAQDMSGLSGFSARFERFERFGRFF